MSDGQPFLKCVHVVLFIVTIRVYMHSRVMLSTRWCVVVSVSQSNDLRDQMVSPLQEPFLVQVLERLEKLSRAPAILSQGRFYRETLQIMKAHPEISFWFCRRHVFSSFVSHILLSGCWNWIVQVVISPTLFWFLAETSRASLYSSFNKFVPHKQDCGSYSSCYCPESLYKTHMIKHG